MSVSKYRTGAPRFGNKEQTGSIIGEVVTYKLPDEELERLRRETGYMKMPSKELYLDFKAQGKSDSKIISELGLNHNVMNKLKRDWDLVGKTGRGRSAGKEIARVIIDQVSEQIKEKVAVHEIAKTTGTKGEEIGIVLQSVTGQIASSKIILPREVARAIDNLRKDGHSDYNIVSRLDGVNFTLGSDFHILSRHFGLVGDVTHPDELIKALVIGYEVERTPEEMILSTYEKTYKNDARGQGFVDGMIYVLNVFDKKIDGVNVFLPKAHA